ncbi:tetratricopeptide repeat protein [Hyphomicrobium sp.]|uniref:tetratricopeptide repeat protein n=1 Tax=Hyphomicrobium sp. TaxID=82 RepID=UPI002E30557B|nr:tetratricopeptide repeat protein [Hyphomicrobium sp.]HEX2843575.1 tetratricopeptide repeat protein [Hyphomicrobium sp.]
MILIALAPLAAAAQSATSFSSPREALRQGVSAYQGGYYEIAVPALEYAAAADEFMANYYLARIYQDNTGPLTNHAKAYALFEKIADDHLDADPDDPRAKYVGKALTALAGYVLRGLPEIGLAPDAERAVFYLKNASTTFNDEDAQFELAKLQLKGEGVETNVALGRHWLSVLSQNGHAGAQAFFADLLWRGKHVEPDPARALALIAVAVDNAPVQDAMWIEDIYQNIFCGAGEGTRKQATGIVAQWGDRYGRKPTETFDRTGLGQLASGPIRTCKNGEPVDVISTQSRTEVLPAASTTPKLPASRTFNYSTMSGDPPQLRDVNAPAPAPQVQVR